ncbi:Wzz/FepE/Etk N-terminal domain-containing protein [Spirosoma areae]
MNTGSGEMLKRLASVAGFAGMDFGGTDEIDAVRPDLYPNVLQSTPFVLYLINQLVTTSDGQQTTIGQFLLPVRISWLSARWLALFRKDTGQRFAPNKLTGTVQLSLWQQDLAEEIEDRVSAKLDTRSGIITIAAKMPDANVSAAVAQIAMNYLTHYVTDYRTGKARQDLWFYRQRLTEADQRYQKAQLALFQYNDSHQHLARQVATLDRERMEAELTIAQTVYTELLRQFEQAKLKVQSRTPVFKVLEPPKIPLRRVSPKRTVLMLFFALAGLGSGALFILIRRADLFGQVRAMLIDE